jgi:hypothetical protein
MDSRYLLKWTIGLSDRFNVRVYEKSYDFASLRSCYEFKIVPVRTCSSFSFVILAYPGPWSDVSAGNQKRWKAQNSFPLYYLLKNPKAPGTLLG